VGGVGARSRLCRRKEKRDLAPTPPTSYKLPTHFGIAYLLSPHVQPEDDQR
jgi:hypothetical protein